MVQIQTVKKRNDNNISDKIYKKADIKYSNDNTIKLVLFRYHCSLQRIPRSIVDKICHESLCIVNNFIHSFGGFICKFILKSAFVTVEFENLDMTLFVSFHV